VGAVDRDEPPAVAGRTSRLDDRTSTRRRSLAIAFGAALIAGVVVGFLPFSVKEAPCGSPFVEGSDAFAADLEDTWSDAADIADNAALGSHQEGCAARRASLRPLALGLVAIGGAGIAALVVRRNASRAEMAGP
jgi:hypothetical protein